MCKKDSEKTNIGKILAITLAVVGGACAVIWFAMKLYRKYCLIENCDDDFDMDLEDGDADCEIIIEGADNEEAPADDSTEDAPADKDAE